MKKIYQSAKFRKFNLKKSIKGLLKRNKKYSEIENLPSYKDSIYNIKDAIIAPIDFRFVENTEQVLKLYSKIRSKDNISNIKSQKYVEMSFEEVKLLDYGTLSVLTAITDDLKSKNILFRANYPKDSLCKSFLIDSGFLANMFDSNGNKIKQKSNSELIFFEKGSGKLLEKDNRKISELVKKVVFKLTGETKHCKPIKTLILEICGNSIEWGNTTKKQWLFGLKYESDKVIFTVTDVGIGILSTLYRKFGQKLSDLFQNKTHLEILTGAFEKKYGSNTLEVNRNKGLPSIRINYEIGNIKNLIIVTNDVILRYDNNEKSKVFAQKTRRFKGTFYQWEMDNDCMNKIFKIKQENGN